jgi:S1-C subfamily serine protease
VASSDFSALLRTQLSQFIAAQFGADAAADSIREGVLAHPGLAALDRGDLLAALEDLLSARGSSHPAPLVRPRMLVDWGELPQIGRSARPLFSLIGPGTAGRPAVRVTVDRGLDTDAADPLRQVRTEESGLWTFYIPFSLTMNGLDARPGLYVIDVEVTFPHAGDGQPRFLRTQIRLNVPDGSSDRRELVIDGDGQSVVNLAGHDLRSFSRVVLKGDDKSIINLQNFSQEMAALPEKAKEAVVFEYELKINRDIEARLPRRVDLREPSRAEAITLHVGDRRIHVLAKKRLTFGRSRRPENNVCLRFLPRSAENDEASRAISRTHMAIDFVEDGLLLVDESTKGFDIDHDPVKNERLLTHLDASGSRQLDLPSGFSGSESLEMDLAIFGRDPADAQFRSDLAWDDVCFDIAEEAASRLWQTAGTCGIEALRLQRLNNLVDEEYVALYRHATIGRSPKDHPIAIRGLRHPATEARLLYAGRMFWLQSAGRVPLVVDGRLIEGACLVPLAFGSEIVLDGVPLSVSRLSQAVLDDDADGGPPRPAAAPERAAALGHGGSTLGTAPTSPAAVASSSPPPPAPTARLRAAAAPPPPPPGLRVPPAAADLSQASAADPVRVALQSVAVVAGQDGHGSGFLAAPGILVTNYHVVADEIAGNLTAAFPDHRRAAERVFAVEVLHEDPASDLAFLRIDADIPHLVPREGFRHRNGHRIVAIGSPGVALGQGRLENLVTDGRLGPIYQDDAGSPAVWSLSMTVNPGNSGGPIVDAETGEVLGVIVAKFTDTDGHSLAVPHEQMMRGLERALEASRSEAGFGSSLHRQRWCQRSIDRMLGIVSDAAGRLLADMSERSASGSDVVYSLVCDFTGGVGTDLAAAVKSSKPTIDGELTLLRSDGCCPAATITALERAWGATERLVRQLGSEVGRLEVDIFADDVRAALARSRSLLDALQAELAEKPMP